MNCKTCKWAVNIIPLKERDVGYYQPGHYCQRCDKLKLKTRSTKLKILEKIMSRSTRPIHNGSLIDLDQNHMWYLQEKHRHTDLFELELERDLLLKKYKNPLWR